MKAYNKLVLICSSQIWFYLNLLSPTFVPKKDCQQLSQQLSPMWLLARCPHPSPVGELGEKSKIGGLREQQFNN